MKADFQAHPIAKEFPPLSTDDFAALRNNIRERGLIHPIVLFQGQILDGWHRWQACVTEGVEPRFEEYEGDDPRALVESLNVHRRHLTQDDRKRLAKAFLAEGDSYREAGRKAGLHHSTVSQIAKEVTPEPSPPPNGETSHSDLEDAPSVHGEPIITIKPRREASGRKARSRKPSVAKEAKKAATPKPIVNSRDAWVESTSRLMKISPADTLGAIIMMVHDDSARLRTEISEPARRNLVTKFAQAMGYNMEC